MHVIVIVTARQNIIKNILTNGISMKTRIRWGEPMLNANANANATKSYCKIRYYRFVLFTFLLSMPSFMFGHAYFFLSRKIHLWILRISFSIKANNIYLLDSVPNAQQRQMKLREWNSNWVWYPMIADLNFPLLITYLLFFDMYKCFCCCHCSVLY